MVHQLDPINTLIYTSIAFLISEKVEAARIPEDERVACSYRIGIGKDKGTFFSNGAGYSGFIEKCRELSEENSYVLVTDITDFYNQIYVHRLQNAIEYASPELFELSNNTERFLLDLNGSVSQGVPVGPAASIIMAEAVLIDVDNYIRDAKYPHSRYVDDFRIFGNSEVDLRLFLEIITKYLYENHRLTIASGKTEIIPVAEFCEKYLNSPEEVEKAEIHGALSEINSPVDAYSGSFEEESAADEGKVRPTVLTELMERVLSSDKLDLGLARHILRKCRMYKIRAISNQVLDNFEFLSPVISDVILYLSKVANATFVERNKDKLVSLFQNVMASEVPFIKEWIEYYIANDPKLLEIQEIRELVMSTASIRNQASMARNRNMTHWVRGQKANMSHLSPWDRRSLIYSGLALSKAELNGWLNSVEKSSANFTEQMTIKWVRSLR
ncbi:MAG TPA: RNA-directed DNA polymerase [Candidatus Competibacteraceae bacterium]|nr:RNA-directed DNA polymerase [Candidatus Competibacteraceae bacterium]